MTPMQHRYMNRLVARATRPARVKNALVGLLIGAVELALFLLIVLATARVFGW